MGAKIKSAVYNIYIFFLNLNAIKQSPQLSEHLQCILFCSIEQTCMDTCKK